MTAEPGLGLIGLLTIGQSPRPDLCEAIVQALPPGASTLQAGLLDGLGAADVERDFAPRADAPVLITRFDGHAVSLDAHAVEAAMQRAVDALEARGATQIVVLCTGSFPALRTRCARLVEPDGLLTTRVAALLGSGTLGLIAPLPEQIAMVRAKWSALPTPPLCEAASPYGPLGLLVDAARELARRGASMIVMDCMGYGRRHEDALRSAGIGIGIPVMASAAVVASAMAAADQEAAGSFFGAAGSSGSTSCASSDGAGGSSTP